MHGYGSLPGSRNSLDNHVMIWGFTDNIILFLLDSGNNFSQYGLFVFRQIFGKKVIIGNHLGIIIIQQSAVLNFIGALHPQVYFS